VLLSGVGAVGSGWSDVDRQACVCLSTQFNTVALDGRQHWLRY